MVSGVHSSFFNSFTRTSLVVFFSTLKKLLYWWNTLQFENDILLQGEK